MKKLLTTIWQAFYPLLIETAVNLIITFAAVMFFAGLYYRETGLLAVKGAAGFLDSNLLFLTGIVSLFIIPVYMLLVKKDAAKYGEQVVSVARKPLTVFLCIAASVGTALAGTLMMKLLGVFRPEIGFEEYANIFDNAAPLVMAVVTLILTPLCDELLFRGLLFKRISRAYGFWPAALISSLFYGITFGDLSQGFYGFVMGLVYALAFQKTGKVWIPVVMHMASSTFIVLVDALTEGLSAFSLPFQVALSALGAGLGAAILVASLFYLKNYRIPAAAPEDVPETEGSGKE